MTARPPSWLTTRQFAAAAGISRINAHKALARCLAGGEWRDHRLAVSAAPGRGGRAGLSYRVGHDSLPPELQERAVQLFPELATAVAAPAPVEATAGDVVPVATVEVLPPERPRDRWPRKPRSDRGAKRVHLSRTADAALRAAGLSDETIQALAGQARDDVRSIWKEDTRGWRHVQGLALPELMKRLRAAGFAGSDAECRAIATLPRGFIDSERGKGLAIARATKDRKADFDRKPRVRRDWNRIPPGYCIIGDVHPVDILYRRADGTTATPKAVCWMDARSRYLIVHPVFLDAREGIRQEHVAASFAQAVQDEAVMPTVAYVDNGGEYNWIEVVAGLKKLAANPDLPLAHVCDQEAQRIIKAGPYRPQSKPIEPRFRVLENAFRTITGWIGGNRMAKPTANLGRAPEPHPDAWGLWQEIQRRVDWVNDTPMDALGGRTPRQVFAERERYEVDLIDLQVAFAKPETRALTNHEFRLNNVYYCHDVLDARPDLDRVVVYVPIFGARDRLAVETPDGEFLCHAEPARYVDPLDGEGAREAQRRQRLHDQAIREWRNSVAPVDIGARMEACAALNPTLPPPKPATVLELTGEKRRAVADRKGRAEPAALPAPEDEFDPKWMDLARELDAKAARRQEEAEAEEERLRARARDMARKFEGRTGT